MVWGLNDVEGIIFSANMLRHISQLVIISTSITLEMYLNGIVWWHAIDVYFMKWIWISIPGTCLIVKLVLRSILMFVSSTCKGSNSLPIREVLILKTLLMQMELPVLIEWGRWFRVRLLMQQMVMNFRLRLILANKGIFLKNRISPRMLMFFLALIIYSGAVI